MPSTLITGGSRGFGKALSVELAARGWEVSVTGRSTAALNRSVPDRLGVRTIPGDVTDEAHRRQLADTFAGGLDLLVNNASALGPSPLVGLSEIDDRDVRTVFDTNVLAPLALTKALLPAIADRKGVVVNLSSDAGIEAYAGWGAYGASKAALDHASAVLAVERPDIRIYAFDPGDMRTDMHQAAFPNEDISDRPHPQTIVPALISLLLTRPASGRYTAADFLESVIP